MKLDETDIRFLKGIGDAKAKQLLRLGVFTLDDLLRFFPARFEDRTQIKKISSLTHGETACINATVVSSISEHYVRKGLTYYKTQLRDESGMLECIFFNNKYIKSLIKVGHIYSFYGKVNVRRGRREMLSPEFEKVTENNCTKAIIPIYPLTDGITQKFLRTMIKHAYELYHQYIQEVIPSPILKEHSLCGLSFAIKNIHFPKDFESLSIARNRLIFEEFFILQTALRRQKLDTVHKSGKIYVDLELSAFLESLPFALTGAQKKVVGEIISDFQSGKSMNRLIQGDVGSGKTIVAAIALYLTSKNGFQSAMMAPTEVLAQQHYNDLSPLLENFGIKCSLLTGSISAKQKKEIYSSLSSGNTSVVFGTHALITEKVEFSNLALAITDEQHRFGVRQRMILSEKGDNTHTLVMTATPIPRSLALIIYGDMDISVIDELPPGRQTIDTFCVGENMRERLYAFIQREIANGNQCYIVCPAVDETENIPLKSATELYEELKTKVFPEIPVGLVHGKMRPTAKETAMQEFVEGRTKLLVSTTVIEVGVNVPSATLMIIENAERFGLSQLHQLRGRVGRGSSKSYCILLCQTISDEIKERMKIMTDSNDGFKISEKDLQIRGPGDFFGTRQHGAMNLKIADISKDIVTLKKSASSAEKLLDSDRSLSNPENYYIKILTDKLISKLSL